MIRRSLTALTFGVLALPALSVEIADACTPIDYHGEFPRGGVVEQMVANAATIQVMRASSSIPAWRYSSDFPTVYAFTLEPIDTWKGWDLGPLTVHGDIVGAFEYDWARGSAEVSQQADSASWEDPSVVDWFQIVVEPEPGPAPMACRVPFAFQIGETYLVFRDANGGLLENAFRFTQRGGERWLRGPAIMPASDRANNWLQAVRAEVSRSW